MALAMVSSPAWHRIRISGGGGCDAMGFPSSGGMRKSGRFVVVAAKRFKRMKKDVEEDVPGFTSTALPFLDDYPKISSSTSNKSLLQKSDIENAASKNGKAAEENVKDLVMENGKAAEEEENSKDLTLEEFLKARVLEENADADEEEKEENGEKVDVWEGDMAPMNAEEEKQILAEAQRELAQLRKKHGEVFGSSSAFRRLLEEEDEEEDKSVEVWRDDSVEVWKDEEESTKSASSFVGGDSDLFSDDEEDTAIKGNKNRVPAVMRCFDRAKVFVKAGDGGNGEVAFRREKFVPYGGPSGGSGGRGGNVYVEVDASLNSLLCFRKSVHFRAGRGGHGLGKAQDGAFGEDAVVRVPPGTLIREANGNRKVLLELTKPGERKLLLPGGRGGRGNAAFKTAKNTTPQMSEKGEEGAEMWVELELKLVADVGIIGVPNAGKSTLLSAISAARPEIAAYPFTTLLPNLGVVSLGFDATMVVADLPGLLEGAHAGYGLGHEFLRHTERCKILIHVIDGTSPQPELEYDAVRLELQLFNPMLSTKTSIVAYNKMDIPEAAERWERFQKAMESQGVNVCCMSAATTQGTIEVVRFAYRLLQACKDSCIEEQEAQNDVAEMVKKERSAPVGEFEIVADPETDSWRITGAGLERFTQMTNWEYFESLERFERVLEYSGVNAVLKSKGIHEGDRVVIGEMAFTWHDSKDIANAGSWSRGLRGSKNWPH